MVFKLNNLKNLIEIFLSRSTIVLYWANKKRYYEAAWAFLSTLGGACNSLGEDSVNFVSIL